MTSLPAKRAGGLLVALLLAPSGPARSAELPLPEQVEFNRDIRPILSENCFYCHGPDKAKRKADLRLDLEASAKAKLDDHFAIVPGDPAQSELIRRITATDPDDHMPPPDSGRRLTARQIELLRRWIAQGAKWQAHWSLIAPVRNEAPRISGFRLQISDRRNGEAGFSDWGANPIDGCDSDVKPVIVEFARIARKRPSLNPVRGTKSNRATTFGVIRTRVPNPNDAP